MPAPNKGARLVDVADRAGVSKATASNVFNRPDLVRPEVRARVLAAAQAIGYAGPDPRGRLLSAGKVNAIGVATAEELPGFFTDPFLRTMMTGIAEACDEADLGLSLVSAANPEALAWSIKSAVVDGLILFCLEDADRLIAEARERRLPFVALSFGGSDETVPVVGVDDVAGARLAAEHVASLGHRRVAILSMEFDESGTTGPATMERVSAATYATSRERVEGYHAGLAVHGVDPADVPVFETANDPATVDAALAALFAGAEPPTALLCQCDRIALRALDWLAVRGIPVPAQVSVIGYDGVPEAATATPPLTTIAQPIHALGRRAVEILLARAPGIPREELPVALVVRGSTAAPPA